MIEEVAVGGFAGGRVYDALITATCYHAGVKTLLTWNLKHFLSIAPPGLDVREP